MRLFLPLSLLLFGLVLNAQEMVLQYSHTLTPRELEQLQRDQAEMMCTANPPLVISDCRADDRTDPANMEPPGTISWTVTGGVNPVSCRLISDAGPVYIIVGGFGPLMNLYNTPNDFQVNNTTTSQTCIVGGGYTIEVTDAEGCIQTCQINFVPTCFDYASSVVPTVTDASCGSLDGCIDLGDIPDAYCPDDPSAGSVSYSWSHGGPNSPNVCNLAPGTYSVTMTDFYGCDGIISGIVVEGGNVEIDNCGWEMPTLIGGSDGQAFFNIEAGTAPFTVTWSGTSSGSMPGVFGPNTINGLSAGTYLIVVTDASGCTDECEVTIENPACTLTPFCPVNPNDDNTFTFNFVGGVAPYTISYTGPGTGTATLNTTIYTTPVLASGNYIFTISDANGAFCQYQCNGIIPAPDCSTLMLDGSQLTHVDCAGSLTGAIDVTLSGGYPAFSFSWTGPDAFTATTEDLSGLAAGTYTLNVSDEEDCELNGLTFTITQPDSLLLNCSATQSDFGQDNGTISVGITGGTPPYSVNVDGTDFPDYAPDSVLQGYAPGPYAITVTDANGCVESCNLTVEEIQCEISIVAIPTNPTCVGATDGSISLTIMDAAGDTTILWSVMGNDGQSSINNLGAGTYWVIVGDTACTLAADTIVLTDPPAISINLTRTADILCHGDSTASIGSTVMNGVGNLTYNWNSPLIGNEANPAGLPAGSYQVTVTDENGCTATDNLLIGQPQDLMLNCSATGETASGANDGTINLDISGLGPMTISGDLDSSGLTIADSPVVLTGQSPGTYSFTLTDANGCTENCTVVVDPGGCQMTVSLATTQPNCSNPNRGSILATVSNGTTPLTYSWSPDLGNTDNPANLAPGIYQLLVTDGLGCSATAADTIVAFTDFPDLTISPTDSICAGDCIDLQLMLTGTPPFFLSYQLVNNTGGVDGSMTIEVASGNDTLITLCPADFNLPGDGSLDNYVIQFTDLADAVCDEIIDVATSINPFPVASDTIRQQYCVGDTVTIAGQDFYHLNSGGEITLSGQSANGCDSLIVVDLTFVEAVYGDLEMTICENDSLVVEGNVFDATTPSGSFVSSIPSSLGCDSIVDVSLTFYALPLGNFTSTVCLTDTVTIGETDFHANNPFGTVVLENSSVNGCDSTVVVELSFFPDAIGNLDTTICTTASFTVEGQTFDIDNPLGLIEYPGQSVNGCDSVLLVIVDFFPPSVGSLDTTICSTAALTINGTTFDVDNPSGDVVFSGGSSNGCDSTLSVTVNFHPPATGSFDTTICATASYTLGGVTFDIDNPAGEVLLPGASINGCDSTVSVIVDFFPLATGTFDTTICSNAAFQFNGLTFDIDNPGGDVLLAGASVNGCDSTVNVTVSFFEIATGSFDTVICATGTFLFNGVLFDVDTPSGEVVLPGASVNGCDSTVSVSLDFYPPAIGTFDTTLCAGGSLSFGGISFDETNPTGTVTLPGASVQACDSIVNVSVDFRAPITVELLSLSGNCSDTEFTLTFAYNGSGDLELSLSNTTQGTYLLNEGTNTLVVTPIDLGPINLVGAVAPGESCPVDFTGSVEVPSAPELNLQILSGDGNNAISCHGGEDGHVRAVLTGGDIQSYTFNWEHGALGAELTGLSSGIYTVTASNPAGCSVTANVELSEPLPLSFAAESTPGDCFGTQPGVVLDTIFGGSGGPYLFRFDERAFAPVGDFPVALRYQPGEAQFEIQDVNGCITTERFNLPELPLGEAIITPPAPTIQLGDSVLLSLQTNLTVDSLIWNPAPDTSVLQHTRYFVSPRQTTTYTVTVIDPEGCLATTEVLVLVDRRVPVFAPTAISPNSDGVNDLFTLFGDRGILNYQDLVIVDRWGDIVHQASGQLSKNDPSWAWDGTHRGEPVTPGVYVYKVWVNLADGRRELLTGDVTVLR